MDTQQQKLSKVLVIGDSCIDLYHYGDCDRISPEAPVPVLKVLRTEGLPGMADNVAKNIESLHNKVETITNVDKIHKIRYVDNKTKQHLIRVDVGEDRPLLPLPIEKVNLINFSDYDCVVMSDYNKGFLRERSIAAIIKKAKQARKPIFVDSKKNDLTVFKNCFIKINEAEYKKAKNIPNSSKLIVTLGAKGALFDGKIFPVEEAQVFDVCGAGDTFLAGLVTKYLVTKDIEEAIEYANKCAAVAVKKFGTYVINKQEVN